MGFRFSGAPFYPRKTLDMKQTYKLIASALCCGLLVFQSGESFAGNKDRAGQAGASELLINPWARSSGLASSNVASVKGLDAQFLNVAGLAFTKRTELSFVRTNWLAGSGINLNALGLSQRIGSSSVLGFGFTSMNFGDIQRTTVDNPGGGIGNFTPRFLTINVSYAKEFSNSIYGGVNLKVLNESIANMSATGVALDAGIQYVTGKRKEVHFGISLRNVGTPMSFSGDGNSLRATLANGNSITVEQRSAKFDLPSSLSIGGAYDFYLSKEKTDHRITASAAFLSNSYTRDGILVGGEYAFKNMFSVRAAYAYENEITSDANRTTALTGLCTGASFELPLNKAGALLGIDYSYRTSNPFSGSHSIGIRVGL